MNDFVDKHKAIITMLKNKFKENKCVEIIEIAKMLQYDVRTVRHHLELAEIDNFGYFTDSNKKIFCNINKEGE